MVITSFHTYWYTYDVDVIIPIEMVSLCLWLKFCHFIIFGCSVKKLMLVCLGMWWVTSKHWQYYCEATALKCNTNTAPVIAYQQWLLIMDDVRIDGDWWNELMNWQIELKCALEYNIYLIMNDSAGSQSMWAYQRKICGQFGTLSPFLVKAIFSCH